MIYTKKKENESCGRKEKDHEHLPFENFEPVPNLAEHSQIKWLEAVQPASSNSSNLRPWCQRFKDKSCSAKIWIAIEKFLIYLVLGVYTVAAGIILFSGTMALIASIRTTWRKESDFITAWLEIMMCIRNKMNNPAHTNNTS